MALFGSGSRGGGSTAPSVDPNKIKKPENIYDPSLYNVKIYDRDKSSAESLANLQSADADVRAAQDLSNRYFFGNDRGNNIERYETGIRHQKDAAINRIALKKALAESISGAPGLAKEEERLLGAQAGSALDTGLQSTRKNYSDRGLLYSGMRQAGEQGVRNKVAGTLASAQSQSKKDLEALLTKQKAAFAAIGLGDYQQKMDAANQAFEDSYRNKIARQQAMQQMFSMAGQGLGMMKGYSDYEKDRRPENTSDPR